MCYGVRSLLGVLCQVLSGGSDNVPDDRLDSRRSENKPKDGFINLSRDLDCIYGSQVIKSVAWMRRMPNTEDYLMQ